MGIVRSGGGGAKAMMEAVSKYNYACGETLGGHLAEKFDGSRVIILVMPESNTGLPNDLQDSMLAGLKKGMGSSLEVVSTIPLKPSEDYLAKMKAGEESGDDAIAAENMEFLEYEMMSYDMWFDAAYLSDLLAEHAGTFDVLISTIGLPMDFAESKLADQTGFPDLAVLNAPMYGLKELYKPNSEGWKGGEDVPEDTATAFAKRYVLLTPDNVEEFAGRYPDMFD
jgi:hypothetical protein